MHRPILICLAFFFSLQYPLNAQMWVGQDTLYGNEWIDYSKTYYKIKLANDGLYRIEYQALSDAGFPISATAADAIRLYHNGVEVPLYISTDGILSPGDFLEFFGEKNKNALDQHLFEDPESQLVNPRFSLFNDTASYFLVVEAGGVPMRYENLDNDLNNIPPADEYAFFEDQTTFSSHHVKRRIANEITYSWFDGNGFGRTSTSSSVSLSADNLYVTGPNAVLQYRYACDLGPHHQQVWIDDQPVVSDSFSGWQVVERSIVLDNGEIDGSVDFKLETKLGGSDRHTLAFVSLIFPGAFHFDQLKESRFSLFNKPTGNYFELNDFSGGSEVILLDTRNKLRLNLLEDASVWKGFLPSIGDSLRPVFVAGSGAINTVTQLEPVNFRNFTSADANFILLSNSTLNDGSDPVAAYKNYRSSPAGGAFSVAEVDIQELYNQFAYGQDFHPIAIRNFVHFIHKEWTNPRHLLIIGKGLEYPLFRKSADQQMYADSLFFIPMYGTPGSDMPFAMERNRLSKPLLNIGRLAVTNSKQIFDYLDKLQSHESQVQHADQNLENRAWMKRVLHLSGGLAGEASAIKSFVNSMESVIETNRFGGDVHTFYKTSNDPVQVSAYNQILDLVNGGLGIWMFYGHSSSNAIDFDIGSVDVYNNKGRYPLMMIMGCFSGICSNRQQGLGEQFVLAPERGAIAYFASVYFSYSDALSQFGHTFYHSLGGSLYGEGVGEHLRFAIDSLKDTNYKALIALLHQNVLQGDPAVRVHPFQGPDYLVDPSSVRFTPNPVSLESTLFRMDFDLVNIGQNTGGNLPFRLNQLLPDGSDISLRLDTIAAPGFRQTVSLELPTQQAQAGINRILLQLDPDDVLEELPAAAEFNNRLIGSDQQEGEPLYFYSNEIAPVFPPDFYMLGKDSIHLFASALQSDANAQRYLLEIDTAYDFSSPVKSVSTVNQSGGLISWVPDIPLFDSTVYYWRVARDSLIDGAVVWRNSSFLWKEGIVPGWNQNHFGQFLTDSLVNLRWDTVSREMEFVDNASYLWVKVAWRNSGRYPGIQNAFIEGSTGDYGWSQEGISRGVVLMVLDRNSGRVVSNPAGGPYNHHDDKSTFYYWFDTQDSLQRIALMNFVENEIPDGAPVALLAFNSFTDSEGYAPHRWANDSVSMGTNLFQVFENQGAVEIRSLEQFQQAPRPYGLVFLKNEPGFAAKDTIVNHPDSAIVVRGDFFAKWATGQLMTAEVGPAKQWQRIWFDRAEFDDPSDIGELEVYTSLPDGRDSLLAQYSEPIQSDLTWISPEEHPILQLRYQLRDTLTRSVSQLERIRIDYEGVPEGALVSAALNADTLTQGAQLQGEFVFKNISDQSFDSLLVRYALTDDQGQSEVWFQRHPPLGLDSTLTILLDRNTSSFSNRTRFTIEVNPSNDQPELYHPNNLWSRDLWVEEDERNPILDVTFDGQHIPDGALVSSEPLILVTLTDENPYLILEDTSLFTMSLSEPNGGIRNLFFSQPEISFFPPSGPENRATVEWSPSFVEDGWYALRINGRDVSGNSSGNLDYTIRFQVDTRPALSNMLNYPNPFSTSTCFIYTMSGNDAPEHFKMQIMTVSGKVVREVDRSEFGTLKPGTHMSDFCWDGTDQYGDQLTNGVYLYRIVSRKSDGSGMELRENQSVDRFFEGGIGKMVLIR